MKEPKYKVGEIVVWKGAIYTIEKVRNYENYCWVYDFEPSKSVPPFHFTGIAEEQLFPTYKPAWWKFWVRK